MDNSFFIYIEQLELMAFFSGYALIYLIIHYLAEHLQIKKVTKINLVSLLPLAYALVGILYLGLQLKNLYPNFSIEQIKLSTQNPYLKIWGLFSILFLIPALKKKPVLSFLHSLVFFYFVVKDLLLHFLWRTEKNVVSNDMNIYTKSIFINLSAFVFILLCSFLLNLIKRKKIF